METTFSILGIDRGNGKENGNYSSILVMNRDNGKGKWRLLRPAGISRKSVRHARKVVKVVVQWAERCQEPLQDDVRHPKIDPPE